MNAAQKLNFFILSDFYFSLSGIAPLKHTANVTVDDIEIDLQIHGGFTMNLGPEVVVRDPQNLLWLHETISPNFSQGAPNPKKPGEKLPGENVKKVAKDLKEGKVKYTDFPPLETFTLTMHGEPITFSLSNRRLTAFRLSGVKEVKTKPASFRRVLDSLWKMTSSDGGYHQPQMTCTGNKAKFPSANSVLGQFRLTIESEKARAETYYDTVAVKPQDPEGRTIPRDTYVKNEAKRVAQAQFGFRK